MSKAISQEQVQKEIDMIAEAMPVVREIFEVYKKWRLFYRDLGISEASAHKKAGFIIKRDYPNFDMEAKARGLFI